MMCQDCKYFRYSVEKKTWDYPGSEDWECNMGHEIFRSENGNHFDYIPARECNDYQVSYRMTAEDKGDEKYQELEDKE